MQFSFSKCDPSQEYVPELSGFRFLHVRYLVLSPALHVFEHADQPSQVDHIPFVLINSKL